MRPPQELLSTDSVHLQPQERRPGARDCNGRAVTTGQPRNSRSVAGGPILSSPPNNRAIFGLTLLRRMRISRITQIL